MQDYRKHKAEKLVRIEIEGEGYAVDLFYYRKEFSPRDGSLVSERKEPIELSHVKKQRAQVAEVLLDHDAAIEDMEAMIKAKIEAAQAADESEPS